MFGILSEYPRKIWDGLRGLSKQSQYQREVDGNPTPTGQDFSQVIDEVIATQSGVLDLHDYVVKVDNELTATKDDLEKQIKDISLTPGKPGEPGYTPVKGKDYFDGEPGEPGYTPVKGVDYFDGKNGQDAPAPTVEVISEDEIKIGDKVIKLPRGPKGKDGKSIPQKRIFGGGLSGGLEGKKGEPGAPGKDGSGIVVMTAESNASIKAGQAIILTNTFHADFASIDLVGLCIADCEPTFLCSYQTSGTITNADWTNVTGSATLQSGYYFLDQTTAGKLTPTVPTTGWIVRVGRALTPDTLLIEMEGPVKL